MSDVRVVILAAGKGTRMKSALSKVLHKICGRPLLEYVLDIAKSVRSLKTYVVVGHGSQDVKESVGNRAEFVVQEKLLGTADALNRCSGRLKNYHGTLLVLCGDTPLLSQGVVRSLLNKHRTSQAMATVLTAQVGDPQGYGRVLRNGQGQLTAIREQKDASYAEDKIKEINVGVYCFAAKGLFAALKKIKPNARKKEFYLTDVIEVLLTEGKRVATLTSPDDSVVFGVNTRQDLAQAESIIRRRILKQHMDNGVTIVDPATTYIEAGVSIGADTIIQPMSVIQTQVRIGKHCSVGPMARLRSGSIIKDGAEIGNFTEVSRSTVGQRVMMKHFSFLGDATIGDGTNIGAGTVTANFDGMRKNKTIIGKKAFIGSDSVLVAPVRIGNAAVVGAGSVVTKGKNIPAKAVAMGVPARIIKKAGQAAE